MKMDSKHMSVHTESPSVASGEKPRDESTATAAAPTSAVRYYSVMDDEGADDVFIPQLPPPPPSCTATLLPAEESTGATASNSAVTLPVDATEVEVNPRGLDSPHSEEPLMAALNKVDEEVTASAAQMSMDNILASNEQDSPPATNQDQKPMDVSGCLMETGRPHRNNATENEQPEDILIVSEGQENCWETNTEKDNYSKQLHRNHKGSSDETHSDKEGDETKHVCGLGETDSQLLRETLDFESVATNAATDDDDDLELCKCNQNRSDAATNQPQVADFPEDVAKEIEEHDEHASLDCNFMKYDWVRRESGSTPMQELPLPSCSEDGVTMGEQEDGSSRIATDIQQGKQLLHRLQLVQLRHDVQMSEKPHTEQQAVTRGEEEGMFGTEIENLTGEEEREENGFETLKKEEAQVSLMEKANNEDKNIQTKPRTSSSTVPGEPEHQRIPRKDSDDNHSDSCVPPDLFPLNPHETSSTEIPFLSTGHRFSAAETSMERELHEAAQGKQKLQRAGGVFNLAENPDVLEIPFKTALSLESLPSKVGVSQCDEWQFSEQKMLKEISQDIQRELVLVNQGKIPGGYSKGELRQLKETKLLFEAFQRDNPEGPTRNRKSPTTQRKGRIYPSVLERTRSLEMLSLKTCPVSRAQSLRLCQPASAEKEKSPDSVRSKSPTGGSRDIARSSPYTKQDKHFRLCRSMDSISGDASADTKGKAKEANTNRESSMLRQNPFFKLRPALALQPEVEKDIREAKEREEELRRQRRSLYGEKRQNSEDEEKSRSAQMHMQGEHL